MKTKPCSKCKAPKPLSEFYKNRIYRDGLDFYCKACRKDCELKRYHRTKPARVRRVGRDPEKRRRIKRQNYHRNAERINAGRKNKRAANLDLFRQKDRERYARDPNKRILASHKIRAKRNATPGGHWTPDEWLSLLRKSNFKCFYCGCPLDYRNITKDHRTPLCRGGSNEISNIVPACRPRNRKKHSKTAEEYIATK